MSDDHRNLLETQRDELSEDIADERAKGDKKDAAKLAALYRERRQTADKLAALGEPAREGEEDDELTKARRRRDIARGAVPDVQGGSRTGDKKRRRSSRHRGS